MPNGPNGPLRSSEWARVGDPHFTSPDAGGAAPRARPLALGSAAGVGGSLAFVDSELRRGPFSPWGVLGPRPPRAGFWAPSSL
eukprot:1102496-Alexandrium_andersonii.AAC.1